ncbi:hypothetical protein HDV00_009328 [Rhizophlyctis rosea]|nr:hypothetical protein HDV00_009328 [Rhizophlyctis rosea]
MSEVIITSQEVIDREALRRLCDLKNVVIPKDEDEDDCHDDDEKVPLKAKLWSLYNNTPIDGVRTTTYSHRKANFGRVYQDGIGLQNCPSQVRAYIVPPGYYKDIDVVNAIFTVFENMAEAIDNPCPNILEYNRNRKAILEKYNLTKPQVIKMMLYENRKVEIEFFKEIHTWLYKTLAPTLKKQPEWIHI